MAVLRPPNRIHLVSRSPFSPPSCGPLIRRSFAPATIPQYLVSFLLDTTGFPLHNPRHHVPARSVYAPGWASKGSFAGRRSPAQGVLAPRSIACNTCPATPCSALIPIVRRAVIGSARTLSAASSVLPAAISSATFRRPSRRTFACARALSPPAPRFVPARVSPLRCFRVIFLNYLPHPQPSAWGKTKDALFFCQNPLTDLTFCATLFARSFCGSQTAAFFVPASVSACHVLH